MPPQEKYETLLTLFKNFLEKRYQAYLQNNPDKHLIVHSAPI